MKLNKIIDKLENLFPPKRALEGDFIGLQLGNEQKVISNVLVALDVCEQTIDQAIKNRCDLIIAHHPFYRSELEVALADSHFKKKYEKLERNKIAVYIMHTNYDCANTGMNDVLAKMYGPNKIEFLNKSNHLGKIGTFKNPKTLEQMVGITSKLFALEAIQVVECDDKPITKFAICGGSGSRYQIDDAINTNCDLLITGELNYHNQMYANEQGLNVILATHFMEVVFIDHIKTILKVYKSIDVIGAKQEDPITIWK